MIGDLWQDVGYGARMLRKNPGFGLIVLMTLAVGIGANTAIFTVVNAVMLRPLPFADSDRLVRLDESNLERGWPQFAVSHPNFLDWRTHNQSFEAIAASTGAGFTLSQGGDLEVVRGSLVTSDFLTVLGVSPILGRNFLPDEDRPGGDVRVTLLTHGFWQRRLGGDPDVLEKTVTLNDQPFRVVGVLPQSFNWAPNLELLAPLAPDPNRSRSDHRLLVIGKLKQGVSLNQALSEMNLLADRLADQYPDSNRGWSVGAESFYDWNVPEQSRRALVVFLVAVFLVLLIACGNVANLLLARASGRVREVAIRLAMGASRSRIMRQLLAESLLLAVIGGALGVGLSMLIVGALKSMNPDNFPRLDEVSLDGRVLLFAMATSLVTGILFGMAPAIQASRPDLNESLKEGGRTGSGGARRQRVRSVLVVTEVALSVMLLAGAGLLIKSFSKLQDVKPGFEPDNLVSLRVNLPRVRYRENEQAAGFYNRLLSEAKNLPGIVSASTTSIVPMDAGNTSSEVTIPGGAGVSDGVRPSADWRIISPGYFRTLGIPLRGRDFDERDTENGERVTIITEEMARRYWPGEEALGKTVILHSFGNAPMTIIGVAGDVRSAGLDSDLR
ncbi:MAG TPA: ABC transporter permease, partial [Blastocatellia bacterium]|nr:ABC transporter permease [Blastocatellia bacterium]